MQENGLIRKVTLNSKFVTSQPGKQLITIHILPCISKSKGNQTIKFDQLIEYKMANISVEKSYAEWGVETIPRPFPKNSKLTIPLDQQPQVLHSFFLYVQVEDYGKV